MRRAALGVVWTLLAVGACAQTGPGEGLRKGLAAEGEGAPTILSSAPTGDDAQPLPPLRANVERVMVDVVVVDEAKRAVTGLEADNFILFEDGVRQRILSFASEEAPMSLGVVVDMSDSMADKLALARQAVAEALKDARPQDEFFLAAFNRQAAIVRDWTSEPSVLLDSLTMLEPRGRTALFDAIYLAAQHLRRARHERRALLIISDGGDNASRRDALAAGESLRAVGAQAFAMGLFADDPADEAERQGPALLGEFCAQSGGELLGVEAPSELPAAARRIAAALRNQYVMGYEPSRRRRDGRWRKISVRLAPPPGLPRLTVRARSGYYAPTN